jgi:hypothetical protein
MKKRGSAEEWSAARARMLEAVRKRMQPGIELSAEAILTTGQR